MGSLHLDRLRAAHFTAIMSTGIVATAVDATAPVAAQVLFWLGLTAFVVMTAILVPAAFARRKTDVHTPSGDFSAFAYPAAASVLAARSALFGLPYAPPILLIVAAVTWGVFSYRTFPRVVIAHAHREGEPTAHRARRLDTVNATWLLVAVAPLAIAVAAGAIAPPDRASAWEAVAAGAWGIGLIQLVLVGTLVAARLLLVPITTDDEVLPYWVFMGILALALLAGVGLSASPIVDPAVSAVFVRTMAIALWCFATWLLPLMVALTVWHARHHRDWYDYRPAMWSMIFPLGVYSAASQSFSTIHHWDWMHVYGEVIGWCAFALWLAVTLLMVRTFVRFLSAARRDALAV